MVLNPDHVFKALWSPAAHHLAESAILAADLNAARDCLELFFDKYTGSKVGENRLIADALFRDGIILFCSAFDKTNAARLVPEEVYGEPCPDETLEAYQLLQNVRDTFAAHNFGTLRQHNVGVACEAEHGQLKPIEITHSFASFGGWNAAEKANVLLLVDLARVHLAAEISKVHSVLWREVCELSSDQLAERPELKIGLPYAEEWKKGRKSFRQNTRERRKIDLARQSGKIVLPK
jgi:hypothetical protein